MPLAPLPRAVEHFFALPQSDINVAFAAAGVAEAITIPAGSTHVAFSATSDFYMRFNATAAVPSADVTDGTGSELNPTVRRLQLGDNSAPVTSISVIAPVACIVTAMFFKASSP